MMKKAAAFFGVFTLLFIVNGSLAHQAVAWQTGGAGETAAAQPATAAQTGTGTQAGATVAAQPAPPPLKAIAGIDRVVVLPGKTYLNGWAGHGNRPRPGRRSRRTDTAAATPAAATTPAPTVAWTKESGPGDVAFENPAAAVTTATFSAPGAYVLKLTAVDGSENVSSTLNVKAELPPPKSPLDAVYTKTYKINSPIWNKRLKALIVNWIPYCYEKCSDLRLQEGGINNFIQAGKKLAGAPAGRHVGYPFSNAWVHNTVESMCVALMVDPQGDKEIIAAQKAMREHLDDWIPKILAAQEPDGYLQTRFTLDPGKPQRWGARTRSEHEGYVAGYFLEAAIAHYLATNKTDPRLYNAAKKLADCWYDNLGPAPKKAWYDGHQEMEQALVRFGRFVNDMEGGGKGDKYVELAKFLLDCRKNGDEYDQSHLPVIQQYEAVGHSVRAAYTYSGMSDVAVATGDVDYQSAVKSLWDNIVNKKYYVTGGVGSGETSEGFGPNYSLGNNAYCESCANCGELFLQYKMNLAYQDAKYADLLEETLYNAVLGDVDLEGKNFYYQNPLDSSQARYPWHGCPCCVGNFPRVMLMLPTWMYSKSADALYVNLFVGSTVTVENVAGTDVQMVQETDYPWSGKVSITVNPAQAKDFSLKIRVPEQNVSELYTATPDAKGLSSITLNGSPITPTIDKGYAVITRSWSPGDKIDLAIPMEVQRVKASEKIAADKGRVALRYGPLVYNIESVDQNIRSILPPTSPLTTEWKPDLLEGVLVIKGVFADGSPMTAIPNYARSNRVVPPPAANTGDTPAGATAGPEQGRRRSSGRSIVWIKDQ
jgi:DUF1680 family protein